MESTYTASRATLEDWDELEALRHAAERRLRDMGLAQWSDTARGLDQMMTRLDGDEMYLVFDGLHVAGCFAVSTQSDACFWAGDPERDEYIYLYKVMAHPKWAGMGVGRFIVSFAVREAAARQAKGLRLDCWKDNPELRRQWERLGFTYLRTVDAPGRNTGTLMERRV